MMMFSHRRTEGLEDRQINTCQEAWAVLGGDHYCPLETSSAHQHSSLTRFIEGRNVVVLGADVYPAEGSTDARSRMSVLACLAHELSHATRYERGYSRSLQEPDILLDEAETSLDASFFLVLSRQDRLDLVEDASDRIISWLGAVRKVKADDEG